MMMAMIIIIYSEILFQHDIFQVSLSVTALVNSKWILRLPIHQTTVMLMLTRRRTIKTFYMN